MARETRRPAESSTPSLDPRAFWGIAAGLALVRAWLGAALPIFAIQASSHDDSLFLSLAQEIAQGRWLGAYGRLTLAKGPLYPAWVALTTTAGVPLIAAQQVLYVLACGAFVAALAPVVRGRGWRLALLGALLFQPAGFAAQVANRVVREGIYPALTLLALAAVAGTALRLSSVRTAAVGGALAGIALGALWLTREEGVWILPAAGILAAAPWMWDGPRPSLRAWGAALASAVAAFALSWGAVAATNSSHYGVFATNDLSSGAFARAYGALTRVEHARRRRFVPVPAEVRQRLYAVSPAFRELEPHLEGRLLAFWGRGSSCPVVNVCDDIGGGWFVWALRDAAQLARRSRSAGDAAGYWDAVATEVNAACDAGRLPCGAPRASVVEPWRWQYAGPVVDAWADALVMTAWPRGFSAQTPASRIARGTAGPYDLLRGQPLADGRDGGARVELLDAVAAAFPHLQLLGCLAALAALGALAVRAIRGRRPPAPAWWIGAAALAAILARAAILAYVHVTSFPGVDPLYLAPSYPLAVAFAALLAVAWLGRGAQDALSSRTRQCSEPPKSQSSAAG